MSYETNPILNRIKLSKGWKTSFFPTNSLNYSRETRLWFKVYLFLKVYFLLHGVRLLTSEIRFSEKYTKILYLSITKQPIQSKKSRSKWKTKSFLQHLRSPLVVTNKKRARFLLYLDLQKLKKNSFFFFNANKKKIFSRAWIAKPRLHSWINSASLIFTWRKENKLKQRLVWKNKYQLASSRIFFQTKKIKNNSFFYENANRALFSTELNKHEIFWKKKQRNLLSLLTKVQKDIFLFERYRTFLFFSAAVSKNISLQKVILFLNEHLKKKKLFLKHIHRLEQVLKNLASKKNILPRLLFKKSCIIYRKKKQKWQKKNLRFYLTTQLDLLQKNSFFPALFPRRMFLGNQKIFVKENTDFLNRNQILALKQKTNLWKKKTFFRNFVKHFIIKKRIENAKALRFLPKTRFLKKPQKITLPQVFLWKRMQQKKKIIFPKNDFTKKKIILKKRQLFYRLSYKKTYRDFLNISNSVKLRYVLQDLLKKYFSIAVEIKVSWPLSQFKNLKFYRLLFPKYKHRLQNKKTSSLKISIFKNDFRKKYFFIGRNTNHLKFFSTFQLKKRNPKLLGNAHTIVNLWQKKSKKINKYLLLKKKIITSKSEKRLSWSSKAPFISELITTLTLFVKYLDPQPVVDHLAHIIGTTKKHMATLKLIETILRTFHLKRGLGYRIALIGRINGANKSRTIYLRKLNRNRTRQNFSKNVNFALAHARATIGTFAIKIWVYS